MARIAEIMEKDVYTCRADATVGDVIRQLADAHVAGVPIVDAEGRLVGYITDGDIMRYVSRKRTQVYTWGEHMPIIMDESTVEERCSGLLAKPVLEIASRKKIYAEADWDIDEAADLFRREKVKKIAVLEDGRVVGVISESAIIRYLLRTLLPEEGSGA